MDEASKQDLRDQIAKQVWDFEINEQRGAKVSTGMAPWPDDARSQPYCQWAYRHADSILPLILRLLTEAEGRVHAQAIAAAADVVDELNREGPYQAIAAAKYIRALTRPAAELRARIEVARAVAEALEKSIRECDRHALFLKHEKENGGDYEHLKARQCEAEYLAGKIRALAVLAQAELQKDTAALDKETK